MQTDATVETPAIAVVHPGRPNPARGWIVDHKALAEPPAVGTRVLIYDKYRASIPREGLVIESAWVMRSRSAGGRYRTWHETFRVATVATETRRTVHYDGTVDTWEQPVNTFDVEFLSDSYDAAVQYDNDTAAAALPTWAKVA